MEHGAWGAAILGLLPAPIQVSGVRSQASGLSLQPSKRAKLHAPCSLPPAPCSPLKCSHIPYPISHIPYPISHLFLPRPEGTRVSHPPSASGLRARLWRTIFALLAHLRSASYGGQAAPSHIPYFIFHVPSSALRALNPPHSPVPARAGHSVRPASGALVGIVLRCKRLVPPSA